jgi:pimeloyl-ACP methyl ester carboxylesterase
MSFRIDRRALILAIAGAPLSCKACSPPEPRSSDWHELSFEPGEDAPEGQRALVFVPPGVAAPPLLVALHGRGESGRGLEVGARGWRDDYGIERLHRRALAPPLTADDLDGMVTPERLTKVNSSLASAPFTGISLACPYTPDLRDRSASGAAGFGRFIVEHLLPRARAVAASPAQRQSTGIDGVSMGGRLALLVGLSHPDVFGCIGALQPAISPDEAESFAALAEKARARAAFALRLVSSEEDPFLPAVRALSERLRALGIEHEMLEVPGPHDYAWNRNAGGLEMLLWHERVQRGLAPP